MFGPPWDSDPFDINTYLTRRGQNRRSRYTSPPPSTSTSPFSKPPNTFSPRPLQLPKHARFSPRSTESISDLSSSDWDDAYILDRDTTTRRVPIAPRRRYSDSYSAAPDLGAVCITAPRRTADELRTNDLLILPPLANARVALRSPCGRSEQIRVAVPLAMEFEDLTKQVVQCYFGRGKMYTAHVRQRGRMQEPARDATLGEVAHRGEVYREGRMEMDVEIVVSGGEGWGVRGGFGVRGPRGVDEVETTRKREVSRTRVKRV